MSVGNSSIELKEAFITIIKRALKTNISTNPVTLKQYESDFTHAFNYYTTSIAELYKKSDTKIQEQISQEFYYCRKKLHKAFVNIKLECEIPCIIGLEINPTTYKPKELLETSYIATNPLNLSCNDIESESDYHSDIEEESNITNEIIINNSNMALSKAEFLKICGSTINKPYLGEPNSLKSFTNSLELLNDLAENDVLKQTLVRFAKTKLQATAQAAVPDNTNSIEAIIQALNTKITPDDSKVIEGRLLALRTDKRGLQDFSKTAEDLSRDLKLALILEGVAENKANQMSIDKTIEMCRASTRNELVKAVVSSSTFKNPKEVLAKFVTEITQDKKEQQVLSFRTQPRNRHPQNRNQPNQSWSNRNTNNQINRRANYQNRNYSNNNNINQNPNNRRNSRGHNNNNYNNNNYNNNTNRTFYNSNRNHNVRLAQTPGNGHAPVQQSGLGEQSYQEPQTYQGLPNYH